MNGNNKLFTLKNVVGLYDVKETLHDRLVSYYKNKDEYEEYGTTPEKGMLIASIPGCGKSMVINAIRNDYKDNKNFDIIQIQHGQFMRGAVGATARAIHKMFSNIRANEKDAVLLMDEVDNLFPVRGKAGILAKERTATLLEELDGQFDDYEHKIFIVGATNQPFDIDPAVLRNGRLGKLHIVSPPNKQERGLLFDLYMEKMIKKFAPNVDMKLCRKATVKQTYGYVGVDFRSINLELMHAKERNEDKDIKPLLSNQDIALAVGKVKQIQEKKLKDIESFRKVYGKIIGGNC